MTFFEGAQTTEKPNLTEKRKETNCELDCTSFCFAVFDLSMVVSSCFAGYLFFALRHVGLSF